MNLGGPAPTTGLLTSVFCYLPIIVMRIVITALFTEHLGSTLYTLLHQIFMITCQEGL